MICSQCGAGLEDGDRFCAECGSPAPANAEKKTTKGGQLVGYSARINDPAFARYMKHTKVWSFLFALIIAVIAIVGFFIYGEVSSEMDNPQALYIGLGIGGMFVLIVLLQTIGRSRSKTWDGVVADKKSGMGSRKRRSGNGYYRQKYRLYTVEIKMNGSGKLHHLNYEDDDTVYNYYKIGDKVRHHKGLNTFEKYDKSGDEIIFCNACASLNDIRDDKCFRCSCPLLK